MFWSPIINIFLISCNSVFYGVNNDALRALVNSLPFAKWVVRDYSVTILKINAITFPAKEINRNSCKLFLESRQPWFRQILCTHSPKMTIALIILYHQSPLQGNIQILFIIWQENILTWYVNITRLDNVLWIIPILISNNCRSWIIYKYSN